MFLIKGKARENTISKFDGHFVSSCLDSVLNVIGNGYEALMWDLGGCYTLRYDVLDRIRPEPAKSEYSCNFNILYRFAIGQAPIKFQCYWNILNIYPTTSALSYTKPPLKSRH